MAIEEELKKKVIDVCLDVVEMEVNDIGLDDPFSEFEHIDSLKSLDLMTALEREFAIRIPESSLREFETINGVISVVSRHL